VLIVADSKTPLSKRAFAQLGELRTIETPAFTRDAIQDAEMIVVRSETAVGRDLLEGTRVRFVGTATIGTDHVDLKYLRKREIGFASAPGSNANSVAEYLAAALLVVARRRRTRIAGTTIGVVGVGNVGSRVVRMAEGLGMNVLCNDPPLARATGDRRFVPLDALMNADVVTLHVPLTREGEDPTYHLFDRERLARMRSDAILVNTSRGAVVETSALTTALAEGGIRGAVLDVWEHEPDIDTELLSLVDLGTPHIAGYSVDGKVNAAKMLFAAACTFFKVNASWIDDPDAPRPPDAQIAVSDASGSTEEILHDVVSRCYDIEADDADLRRVMSLPHEERGKFFRGLRAGYRVRYEFFHSNVHLREINSRLAMVLRTLGFKVNV
jgi:erythronate-4-phosphate dehydrogenase